jgi:hypothetical protein
VTSQEIRAAAVDATLQKKHRPWGGGFSLDIAHGPIVFALSQLRQDENHLTGYFVFENNSGAFGAPRSVVIHGKWINRQFWPQVVLQVADDEKGPWKTLRRSTARSDHRTVQTGLNVLLNVQLDPFQGLIGKRKLGKVVLSTGDEEIFSLSELSPPPSVDDLIKSGALPKNIKQ